MSAEIIDVHEELAEARVTRFHWRLGATMGALTLFDGYDIFNPAYVVHYVLQPWNLKPGQAGLLISSGLIGFLIGAAVHGLVADRVGGRVTLLGGLWIASIFTLATPILGTSFRLFCTMRLLTGLGLGALLPLATTYINSVPRAVSPLRHPRWREIPRVLGRHDIGQAAHDHRLVGTRSMLYPSKTHQIIALLRLGVTEPWRQHQVPG